jgi:beta-lactamase regulating signal transducer with metallopeptidase domain
MNAVLWALLEVTLTSAVIYGVILIFRRLFKRQLSAAFQFGLWFLLVLRLLVPVTLDSGVHLPLLPLNFTQQQTDGIVNTDNNSLLTSGTGNGGVDNGQGAGDMDTSGGAIVYIKNPAVANLPAANSALQPAAESPRQAVTFDINTLLICLWLAGVAANAAYLLALRLKLVRQMRREAGEVPAALAALVAECCGRLGVRARVHITVQRTIKTPALAVSLRPRLLFSLDTSERFGMRELRCSILHELTHWKRRDPWLCLLLNALRCAYWFNPVVWLMARQVRMDMETACDAAVVRHMGTVEKKEYAGVILSMFSSGGRAAELTLGMAMENNRATAERRIRGVFMRGRTHRGVRALAAVTALILLFACFTTGCMPTNTLPAGSPPAATVQPTGSPNTTPTAASPAGTSAQPSATPELTSSPSLKFTAPQAYKDSFMTQDGKVLVNVDASVLIPDIEKYPIVRMEPMDISVDMVKSAVKVLMAGQPVYEPRFTLTKGEYDAQIKDIQYAIDHPKESDDFGLLSKDPQTVKDQISNLKNSIASLKKYKKIAPESFVPKPAEMLFKPTADINKLRGFDKEDDKDSQTLMLDATLQGGFFSKIEAVNNHSKANRFSYMLFMKGKSLDATAYPDMDNIRQRSELKLSTADAIATAMGALHGMGLDDMVLSDLTVATQNTHIILGSYFYEELSAGRSMTPKQILDNSRTLDTEGVISAGGLKPVYYSMKFKRAYNGAPTTPGYDSSYVATANTSATQYYDYEDITMTVDDSGITALNWRSPMKVIETVTDNTTLLPYDQIIKEFTIQMQARYSLDKLDRYTEADPDYKKHMDSLGKGYINIDKITLGMLRIHAKDNPGKYLMIPVWSFFGSELVSQKTDKTTDAEKLAGMLSLSRHPRPISYLTINAMDCCVVTDYESVQR